MYPFYWTNPVKGVFCMKYDFTFKLNAVEMYRAGKWIDTPEGIGQKTLEKELCNGRKLRIYMVWISFVIQLLVKNVLLNIGTN